MDLRLGDSYKRSTNYVHIQDGVLVESMHHYLEIKEKRNQFIAGIGNSLENSYFDIEYTFTL